MRGVIQDDLAALVRIPSPTGQERRALEWLATRAGQLGLEADLRTHSLDAIRAHPDFPGAEAERDELLNLAVTRKGRGRAPKRLAICAHLDTVGPGTVPWRHGGPHSGAVEDGRLYGRGSVDMKAGVIAALHALATAAQTDAEVVGLFVSSEEDGGAGAFAALQEDARYDAGLIPEPTGWEVVCAQAGALTFTGTVRGRSTHAATRLAGRSAIDRYVAVHQRIADHERRLNADVENPLMRELELPYPLLVGRIAGGTWSSQVPDKVTFEGRLGVRIGEAPDEARAAFTAAVQDGEQPPVAIEWTGGAFLPAETPHDHPFVETVAAAVAQERGAAPRRAGVPWGADMRLFTAHGIPTTMVGTTGIERAHAVDEHVELAEVEALTRVLRTVIERF